jgi:beta-lactam-binding protein with PASTA domain
MHFAIHGAEVKVPALKGMTVAEARSQTSGLGLDLNVDNRYYSGDVAAGHILSQSPAPGTVVRREWHVRVAESLGPQTVEVPDAVGSDERVAALRLRRVGLDVGATAHLPYSRAIEGTVLAQDPPPHAQGIAQPSVNLLVAAPSDEAPDGYVMPDLTGMPAAGAQAALAKVGIKTAPLKFVDVPVGQVGAAGTMPKLPVAPGAVIAQWPQAGARVDQTTQVQLTVAR